MLTDAVFSVEGTEGPVTAAVTRRAKDRRAPEPHDLERGVDSVLLGVTGVEADLPLLLDVIVALLEANVTTARSHLPPPKNRATRETSLNHG